MTSSQPATTDITIDEETTMPNRSSSSAPRASLFGLAMRWVVATACLAVVTAVAAAPARAAGEIEITSFSAGLTNYQAGGHPDAFASFRFATEPAEGPLGQPGGGCAPFSDDGHCEVVKGGAPKDIVVELPKGIFGNPRTIPQCALVELNADNCPVPAQVGVQLLQLVSFGTPSGGLIPPGGEKLPIYNMVPERGEVAKFGFRVKGAVNSFISVKLRSDGDYGLTTTVGNIFTGLPLWGADLVIWGDPYSDVHDPDRYCKGDFTTPAGFGCNAKIQRKPFMVAPAECGVDATTTIAVRSWIHPGDDDWVRAESSPEQVTGCDKLSFSPGVEVRPTSSVPDSPTGLDVDLVFPHQFDNPEGLESPPLKDAKVTLPEGMTINPAAADGLEACSDEQLGLRSKAPVACPPGSKIGSVEAETPVLNETLSGGVYIRSQASDDPGSGEMFRLAIVLENEQRGLSIRLPGQVRVNAATGRIETTFADNPQLPVSKISLKLKGGPRAPLATPSTCGTKVVDTQLSAWSGQRVDLEDTFTIDCPGAAGFAPAFDAGSVNPTGGSFSPFVVRIERSDRQQLLSGVSVDLPKGLAAKLEGIPLCGGLEAQNGGCPAGSRIGLATVGAGAGSNPFYVQGDVYLTEGYKGGPYGLAVHVHAKAGPFDLGWVRVRQAVHVDPATAEIRAVSDPLPQVVKGVPVRLRSVDVDIDKPGFTINPTSCAAKEVGATLTSIDGQVHETGRRFQVGDCASLPFMPKLSLALTGKRQVTTGKHPGVKAVVRQTGIGEAGIDQAKVTLPKSVALDPANAQALCEFADGTKPDLESRCPKGSIVGRARAVTPLLDKPLVGNVYFVKNVRKDPKTGNEIRTLPMIVVALRGEIAINLRGVSSTAKDGRLINTFASVPDAPISQFNLNIAGGNNGILAVTRTRKARINLCRAGRQTAVTEMDGQNGKRRDFNVVVKTPCAKQAKSVKKSRNAKK